MHQLFNFQPNIKAAFISLLLSAQNSRIITSNRVLYKEDIRKLITIATTDTSINMSATTYKAKQGLRKKIRSSLSSITPEDLSSQSTAVWSRVFDQLPEGIYQSAKSVGLFLSMPKGEIRTDEACRRVLEDGKTLFVPRVGLDFELCDMDLIRVPSKDFGEGNGSSNGMFYDNWPRNKWGIPEAPVGPEYKIAQPGDIDLLIVPGLGFDSEGGRLGQGKGYYDRFIQKMRSQDGKATDSDCGKGRKKPVLVAVGLEPSFVDEGIPMMDHDFRMDMVVLPNACHTVEQK